MNNKISAEKINRLNTSLNNSKSAKDTLLKSTLIFKTTSRELGLDQLRKKRTA